MSCILGFTVKYIVSKLSRPCSQMSLQIALVKKSSLECFGYWFAVFNVRLRDGCGGSSVKNEFYVNCKGGGHTIVKGFREWLKW